MTFCIETIKNLFAEVEREREDMHPYQEVGREFLQENPFSALFIDMGMGKTVTAATVATDCLADFESNKVLIVGPLRVACETWPPEFRKWRHLAPYRVEVLREEEGDPRIKQAGREARQRARNQGELNEAALRKVAQKAETMKKEALRIEKTASTKQIHIINREALPWLVDLFKNKWPYDTVIIDESTSFKDHQSNRFKALAKVRRSKGLIKRLHILTATPTGQGYMGLFAQIYLLDLGERLGLNITSYRDRYFNHNPYNRKYTLRKGADEQILNAIKDISMVMRAKDYLDVLEPRIVPRFIDLPKKAREQYDTLTRDMVLELGDAEDTVIVAETAGSLCAKQAQMASGVLYETRMVGDLSQGDLKKQRIAHAIHDEKLEALKEIIEALDGRPLLVGYFFEESLNRLTKAFPKATVMDKTGKCIKAWNDGKIPLLFAHPQSAGHGLNLQFGGHNLVMFDMIWSYEYFFQFVGRLARQGQKYEVLVQMLVAKGTVDEAMLASCQTLGDEQDRMLAYLQKLIRQMRKKTKPTQVQQIEDW